MCVSVLCEGARDSCGRNLEWHMKASVVSGHGFWATVDVHVEGEAKSAVDMGLEAIEIVPFEDGKKKGRDADKLHQGFALVRFEQASKLSRKRVHVVLLLCQYCG